MSVLRNLNILSQMRLDVPHIRLLESGVAGDFDTVVGRMTSGGKPLVVKGFSIAGSVGNAATTLQLVVADSLAVNLNASESGSFLWVPANTPNEVLDGATNASVLGSFVSGAVNYVGIDFSRQPDESTTDLVTFIDPVTKEETDRQVPLGKTLSYKIIVDTVPFSSSANIVPIAKVTVDAVGVVTAIVDARRMMFRLAAGGDAPNSFSSYSWPQGRYEAAFSGADKSLTSQKDWMDAVMSRLWEVGGGQNWFSPTADRNVWCLNTGSPFSNGDYFELTGSTIKWAASKFFFDGSGGAYYNDVAADTSGTKTINVNECLYVDLDRSSNTTLTAQIANIANLGTGPRPGSRWILAWRNSDGILYTRNWRYPVGTLFTPATNLAQGVVRLHAAAPVPLSPVVAMIGTNNTLVLTSSGVTVAATFTGGAAGVKGLGAFGTGAYGVWGVGSDDAGGGAGIGVYGVGGADEANGIGVKGVAGANSGAQGVIGEGSLGGAGVKGTGGPSGNGVEGVAGGSAKSGVKGTGAAGGVGVEGVVSGAGTGVKGTGGVGGSGGNFTGGVTNGTGVEGYGGGGDAYGVYGSSTGTKAGVKGVASGASFGIDIAGVEGVNNDDTGVKGTGLVGVKGEGTGANPTGVKGVATGANSKGVEAEATGAGSSAVVATGGGGGRAVTASGGAVGLDPAQVFEFTSTKTGYVFVSVAEMNKVSGAATLAASDGTGLDIPFYSISNGNFARLVGTARLPRGATITAVDAHVWNKSALTNYNINKPNISRYDYNTSSTKMNRNVVMSSSSVTVPFSTGTGWVSMGSPSAGAVPQGSTLADSGVVMIDWDLPNFNPADTTNPCQVAGILITYTYTTVDFMV